MINKQIVDVYERFDNSILTDGGIADLQKIVDYLTGTAQYTRNTIVVIEIEPFTNKARTIKRITRIFCSKNRKSHHFFHKTKEFALTMVKCVHQRRMSIFYDSELCSSMSANLRFIK